MERKILRLLLILGIGLLPLLFKRPGIKDWFIIFFLKGTLASFLDGIITSKKGIRYPIRLLPQHFKINILFDYLLLPIVCVVYNQITYHSKIMGIILKSLLFSIPMTIVEVIFQHWTNLIKFKRGWYWYHTLLSETVTLIFVRVLIGGLRQLEDKGIAIKTKNNTTNNWT